jgi:hypothetical protein
LSQRRVNGETAMMITIKHVRPLLMIGTLAALAATAALAMPPASGAGTVAGRVAQARYTTGIGDQNAAMFLDPNWQRLHTGIARYIAPYDAALSTADLNRAKLWIARAQAANQRILIAFYHSERSPTRLPSVKTYERDVARFIRAFPSVSEYQPWNEANRGNLKHQFSSPSAEAAAGYYGALRKVCHGCTITGLDVLDQNSYRPTLRYIAQFKAALRRLHVPAPHLWGLHNYSDTNRFRSTGTSAIVGALGGTVWLTETGGVIKLLPDFRNGHGSGLSRAARALQYMFRLAASNPRITRLYIFQWRGAGAGARFDAGLTDAHFRPRPGYVVVCRQLHAANCNVKTVND